MMTAENRRYIAENRRFSVITLLSGAKLEQVSDNNFCESRSERQTKFFCDLGSMSKPYFLLCIIAKKL